MDIKTFFTEVVEDRSAQIRNAYFDGFHWGEVVSGKTTGLDPYTAALNSSSNCLMSTLGNEVFDHNQGTVNPNKRYKKVVDNVVNSAVVKMESYVVGEDKISSIFSLESKKDKEEEIDEQVKKLKQYGLWKSSELIIRDILLHKGGYIEVTKNETKGGLIFNHIAGNRCHVVKNDDGSIKEAFYVYGVRAGSIFLVKKITDTKIEYYENTTLKFEIDNTMGLINIFDFPSRDPLVKEDILQMQDDINFQKVRVFEKSKSSVSPILYFTGLDEKEFLTLEGSSFNVGSGGIGVLPLANMKIEKIDGQAIGDQDLELMAKLKDDFWSRTRLEAIEGSEIKQSGQVESGKAKSMRERDTKSYVNSIKQGFIESLQEMLDTIAQKVEGADIFDLTAISTPTIWDMEEVQDRISSMILNDSDRLDLYTKWKSHYITEGKTEEEAKELAENRVNVIFN